jgi:protein TonB
MAVSSMTTGGEYRGSAAALISAALHVLLLALFAATSIRIVGEDRDIIPLVIREPAPPPPPPGAGAGAGPPAPAVVAMESKRIEQAKPIEAPKPVAKAKISARPKPKSEVARPVPSAASIPPTPAEAVAAAPAAGSDAGSGAAGGVLGGVPGGEVGGKIGGRLGGTGDDVWSIDQVAVRPRVIESVRPQYPAVARARGVEGEVIVQAVIDRRGAVEPEALQVVKSQPPFDDAAVRAFRQWKFQPARDDAGRNVRVRVEQLIRFSLR